MKKTFLLLFVLLLCTSVLQISAFADTTVFSLDFDGENVWAENEFGVTLKNISVKNNHSFEKGEGLGIDGSCALYMKSSADDIDGTTCLFLTNPVSLTVGKTYVLSWKMKFTHIGNRGYRMHFYYPNENKSYNRTPKDAVEPINLYLDDIGIDEGWVTYTYTFVATEEIYSIRFGPQAAYGTCFYFDDLTVTLLDTHPVTSPETNTETFPPVAPSTNDGTAPDTSPDSAPISSPAQGEEADSGGYAVLVMIIAFILILILRFFIPLLLKKRK